MSNNAIQELQTTAFGELKVESKKPVAQISAEYGLLQTVLAVVDDGGVGSVSTEDSQFVCQTGTSPDGLAAILTAKQTRFHPGQGLECIISAVFSPGVPNSQQGAGLITSENSFAFGFQGDVFGIFHVYGGENEIQRLKVTTPSSLGETVTITVDGVGYNVTLSSGSVQHNALEIAESLSQQVPNYLFSANNDEVTAVSLLSGPAGAFAFSGPTAAASWTQVRAGVSPIVEHTPQSEWNVNKFPGLDPTKGNVYYIRLQHGYSNIKFFVEDPETAEPTLVHIIKYANSNVRPSSTNPTFRAGWVARNLGNTTNLTVKGAEACTFIEGKTLRNPPPRAAKTEQTSVGTTSTNIVSIRNRIEFGGRVNRAKIYPLLVTASTQTSKAAFFELIINPTFDSDAVWEYVDQGGSIVEITKDKVGVSGGLVIGSITVTAGGSQVVRLNQTPGTETFIEAGTVVTLAARVSSGSSADMQGAITWQEDL